ncbi:DNA polymerase domain-containing protein [Halosimplex sp. TS25]|uniref:DNA polymerase domain-containing protein n=1 Tax=Halosimplex rarum TaxID=3396619 RepID=UPI0039EB9A2D
MSLLTPEFRSDGSVREWHATADGVETRVNDDYAPSLYVEAPDPVRADLAAILADDPKVVETETERRYLSLDADDRKPILRVDLARVDEVRTLAHEILSQYAIDYAPGKVRLYDVDLAPGFRYCVDTDTSPAPDRDLRRLDLSISERALAEDDLTALRVDGERLVDARAAGAAASGATDSRGAIDRTVLDDLRARLDAVDPDVLVCSTAELIPRCHDRAAEVGLDDFRLGRTDGYERLAGASTYESYGQVGHSPARYAVPGRAVVDRSNTFLFGKCGLPGLLDLVGRSWRPLQETARGSIGTILTSIEIREARERDVLAPWNKWEPEAFKPVRTLHDADRGGFTFAPEPGPYEDVVEVDFASLYPNIMRECNVSPETVGCDCCDREDVPWLGYSVCDSQGFVADVLGDLIDDRADFKAELADLRDRADAETLATVGGGDYQATYAEPDDDSPVAERIAALEGRVDALKWVLVSCFGYQGYRNAKFGRIECHEAINAFAREIVLDAKEQLEAAGWRVVHGIVDSLWVQREARPEGAPRNCERGVRGAKRREVEAAEPPRAERPASREADQRGASATRAGSARREAPRSRGGEAASRGVTREQSEVERSEASKSEREASATREPRVDDPAPIDEVVAEVDSDATPDDAEIPLEVEARFDWICFVPMRDSRAGALTKYFGRKAGTDPETGDAFKYRGIETRQRSTPPFVADAQRELIRALDRELVAGKPDPAAVCDRLAVEIARLERGAVGPEDLVIRQRVSKSVEAYSQRTRTVAALERAADHGLERPPGTSVEYVVVDDEARGADRVRLPFEDASGYDVDFYRERLVRAAESVLSPLGWDRGRIRRYLRDGRDLTLSAFE